MLLLNEREKSTFSTYQRNCLCCCRRESPRPIASSALQAFVHAEKANPVILRLCEDSNTKLRIPNLQNICIVRCLNKNLIPVTCYLGLTSLLKVKKKINNNTVVLREKKGL